VPQGEHFVTYFDLIAAPPHPGFDLIVLLGIMVVLALIYVTSISKHGRRSWLNFVAIAAAAGLTVSRFAGYGPPFDSHPLSVAIANQDYQAVEGTVEEFHPMTWCLGNRDEQFKVNGVPFAYSSAYITATFNAPAACGGPIHEGLYVRITNVAKPMGVILGNTIIKLEIRRPGR